LKSYTLSGKTFTRNEFEQYCWKQLNSVPEWEKHNLLFVLKWLSGDEFFDVKTSGSTGEPKTIHIKRSSMEASARITAEFLGLKTGTNTLLCLPSSFIAGKMMIVRALVNEWPLHWVEPQSRPLQDVEATVEFVAMTPMQVETSLRLDAEKIKSIDTLIIGGGAIHPELEGLLQECPNKIFSTYGMTETITHVAMRRVNGIEKSELFRAMNGVSFTQDNRNCLVIHAPHVQAEPLVTNDIIDLKDPFTFQYFGRWDNVINSGGIKVFAEELEQKIAALIPSRFFITKIPDIVLGEKIVLYLEEAILSEEGKNILQQKLKQHLSAFEVPREIRCTPKFEITPTQKIIRKIY
jgi:o-succinylbenzoate---CoA ligase